jgi:aminoglycoside 6'-N-acetyltransferase
VRLESAERPGLVLRSLAPDDAAELVRIHTTPEVQEWWDVPEEGFPWNDDPDTTRLVIEVEGAVAGLIEYWEETEPKYRHAGIDVFLDPALRGRGLGTEAVATTASRSTRPRPMRRRSARTRRSASGRSA